MRKEKYNLLKKEYFEAIDENARICSNERVDLSKLNESNKRVLLAKKELLKNGIDPDKRILRRPL